ncbi:chorismate--pyruvate lyase family protein [Thalassotalea piscium]|uniref:Probable chorismate pyruvate-lyase n=1 Tax=Thalassotalea piscium TaxID=1230533 RepID=A0A7X0NG26_9GAMM|nr:chorismate lyase [Thalassotalea piscium]MBB6542816.1 chorismate--pyruvate lyase [Thalassotalea piscium]
MQHHHSLFPVNLQAQWHKAEGVELEPSLLNWLLDANSLTARLKSHCQQFRVQLLGQKVEPCHPKEANQDIYSGEEVLVREVLLFCDDNPQVFARSLIPLRSLTGNERQLAELGEQSLGQVLFNSPNLFRKDIEIASFSDNSTVFKFASTYVLPELKQLWGRRSVFMLGEKPLMVAEVFLPGAYAYSQESNQ